MRKTIAIIDTETGGFSITKNGICEIALLIVDENLNPIVGHSFLISPYTRDQDTDELVSYKEDSMAIHGITVEQLENEGIPVEEVCNNILEIFKAHNVHIIMAHNIIFDVPRFAYLIYRFTYFGIKNYDTICTLEMSKRYLKQKSNSLPDLCDAFGIDKVQSHRALSDCYSCLGVAKILKERGYLHINLN